MRLLDALRIAMLPVLVLVVGVAFSMFVAERNREASEGADRDRLRALVAEHETEIELHVSANEEALIAGAALYAASEEVSPAEWKAFVETLEFAERYTEMNALGVMEYVPRHQIDEFLTDARARIDPGFSVWTLGDMNPGEAAYVLTLVEPLDRNLGLRGLDAASEPARRSAADSAAAAGKPRMTSLVNVVGESSARTGFILYYPIYRGATPESAEAREAALMGWVLAPLISEAFLGTLAHDSRGELEIAVFDGLPGEATSKRLAGSGAREFERVTWLNLSGQPLYFGWNPGPAFVSADGALDELLAGGGALLSLALAIIIVVLQSTNRRAHAIAKRATVELSRSEQRYRSVLDSLQDIYFETTLKDVLTFQSSSALGIYGPGAAEMVGRPTRDFYVDPARHDEILARLAAGQMVEDFEAEFRIGDRTVDVSINCRVMIADGKPTGVNGTVRAITARKLAERALQKSEHRYRLLIETSTEGIAILSPDDEILFANSGITRMFGYEVDELVGKKSSDFLSSRFQDQHPGSQALAMKLGDPVVRFEAAYCHRDGREVWALLSTSALPLDDGTTGVLVTMTDISDRKRMEEAMLESERRYRETFETLDDIYFKTDRRGAIVMMSPSVFRHTGYTPDELVGLPAAVVFADPKEHAQLVLELMQRRAVSDFPATLCRRDGEHVPASVTASVVEDTSGAIMGFHGTLRDVSERKRMEDAMRLAEERLAGIIESASDAIVSVDGDHLIRVFNHGAEAIFHKTSEEVMGKHISVILPPSIVGERDQYMDSFANSAAANSSMSSQEISGTWADGTPFVLDARVSRVEVGDQLLLTVIVRDISEQKRAARDREALVASLESNALTMEAHSIELVALHAEAERIANQDQLTGVRNRRAWYAEAEKAGHTAVAMFDIDFFKRVNDTHGHPIGDVVLQEVAARLERALEGRGILGRLGGEEFGVVFSTPFEVARLACEDAVAAIAAEPIRLPNGHALEVTISAGIAAWRERGGLKASLEATCIEADGALYHAKHSGRKRLSVGRRRAA